MGSIGVSSALCFVGWVGWVRCVMVVVSSMGLVEIGCVEKLCSRYMNKISGVDGFCHGS